MKLYICLLFSVFVASVSARTRSQYSNSLHYHCSARRNLIFSFCARTWETCRNYGIKRHKYRCWKGCDCKKGFTREYLGGRCISKYKCKKRHLKCPHRNQHYTRHHANCQTTCQFPRLGKHHCRGRPRPGCLCNPGFVRRYNDGKGPCIPVWRCPKKIKCNKKTEMYTECQGKCQTTCKNPLRESLRCPAICMEGCICRHGYVRKYENGSGPCVPYSYCNRKKCPKKHEEFTRCSGHCQSTCIYPILDHRPCTRQCQPGCRCKKGYVRQNLNGTGPCVPDSYCPRLIHCKLPHEHFVRCRSHCDKTCYKKQDRCIKASCISGCACRRGFVRENFDRTGRCVRKSKCHPYRKCNAPHEVFSKGRRFCQSTCMHPFRSKKKCHNKYPGCICRRGFVRRNEQSTSRCIRRRRCSIYPIPS